MTGDFTFMPWRRKWHPLQLSCLENPVEEKPGGLHRPRVAEVGLGRATAFLLLALLGSPAWPPGPGAPQPGPCARLPTRTSFTRPPVLPQLTQQPGSLGWILDDRSWFGRWRP